MNPATPGLLRGIGIVAGLELRQRMRSRVLLILSIVWFVVIGAVTVVTWFILDAGASAYDTSVQGFPMFSVIVYFVLLFGTLVAPAVSAGSIGADRAAATLATTQVTLLGPWAILLGKALAAWITGIAFLVVASPFVVASLAFGQFNASRLLLALLALVLQIGLFTIIGVGLSALISSQVFAIVTAYLVVALLSVGTLIAFALATGLSTQYVEVESQTLTDEYWEAVDACAPDDSSCFDAVPETCEPTVDTWPVTDTTGTWWVLALNPYVVVADTVTTGQGGPSRDRWADDDLFSTIAGAVRSMQVAETAEPGYDECAPSALETSVEDDLDDTVPVWWLGMTLQTVLALLALGGGYRRLRTPARHVPRGSRIA